MSVSTTIKMKFSRPVLTVLNEILSVVNIEQRIELDKHMESNDVTFRPFFLMSNSNLDSSGKKKWTNGARIHSTNFTTFAILFGLDGEKAIMLNVIEDEIFLSMNSSEQHNSFMGKIAVSIDNQFDETVYLSVADSEPTPVQVSESLNS